MQIEQARADALYRMNQAQLLVLVKAGLMDKSHAGQIELALTEIQKDADTCYSDYLALEKELIARLGNSAGNLHLGRSRNDIGATTERFLIRSTFLDTLKQLSELRRAVLNKADAETATVIPAYTHGRLAQPTTFGHYLLAVADSLERDMSRFKHAFTTLNCSPLGAAALTTSGFHLDRQLLASALGFDGLVENSYDAVSVGPGDSKAEVISALMISALTLSRFVQDLILYSMDEFGFLILKRVGGSSIMPQKRNPGFLEAARSELASALGQGWSVFADLHNTHLQDTKDVRGAAMEHVIRAAEDLQDVYGALAEGVSELTVDQQRGLELSSAHFSTATELADTLVRHSGVDFRSGHAVSSAVAAWLRENSRKPEELTPETLAAIAQQSIGVEVSLSKDQIRQALDPAYFVSIRNNTGGPAEKTVKTMLISRRENLQKDEKWIADHEVRIKDAMRKLDESVAALSA